MYQPSLPLRGAVRDMPEEFVGYVDSDAVCYDPEEREAYLWLHAPVLASPHAIGGDAWRIERAAGGTPELTPPAPGYGRGAQLRARSTKDAADTLTVRLVTSAWQDEGNED